MDKNNNERKINLKEIKNKLLMGLDIGDSVFYQIKMKKRLMIFFQRKILRNLI